MKSNIEERLIDAIAAAKKTGNEKQGNELNESLKTLWHYEVIDTDTFTNIKKRGGNAGADRLV